MVQRIVLASCLVIALASQTRADVAPPVAHAPTSIAIVSSDAEHVWVAYPLNFSHGVPMEAYDQIRPGAPFDPGRSWPTIYAFPAASVGEVTPAPALSLPPASGLLGAPRGFGQSATAFADHALADFFSASSAPHTAPLSPPDDSTLASLHVVSLVDTYAPTVDAGTLTLRLVQTDYAFRDGRRQSVPANADGSRALPGAAPAPPPSTTTPSTTTSPPPPSSAPPASGWGCHVGARSSGRTSMLAVLALVVVARRRRRDLCRSARRAGPTQLCRVRSADHSGRDH
jgi:hypothetical protein